MGFFDIFKKKATQQRQVDFSNENVIEKSLRKASTEPAYRAEFYKNLLAEKLVVLTDKTQLPEGVQILQEDTNVNIITLPDGKIPVFTSTSKIFDKESLNKKFHI